jgi:hypothetical protein
MGGGAVKSLRLLEGLDGRSKAGSRKIMMGARTRDQVAFRRSPKPQIGRLKAAFRELCSRLPAGMIGFGVPPASKIPLCDRTTANQTVQLSFALPVIELSMFVSVDQDATQAFRRFATSQRRRKVLTWHPIPDKETGC